MGFWVFINKGMMLKQRGAQVLGCRALHSARCSWCLGHGAQCWGPDALPPPEAAAPSQGPPSVKAALSPSSETYASKKGWDLLLPVLALLSAGGCCPRRWRPWAAGRGQLPLGYVRMRNCTAATSTALLTRCHPRITLSKMCWTQLFVWRLETRGNPPISGYPSHPCLAAQQGSTYAYRSLPRWVCLADFNCHHFLKLNVNYRPFCLILLI